MVVSSVGKAAMKRLPICTSCTGTEDGAQGQGLEREPVGRRMRFGAWHAASSGFARARESTKNSKRGLDEVPFCRKSNLTKPGQQDGEARSSR